MKKKMSKTSKKVQVPSYLAAWGFSDKDFTKSNFIEGAIIRPGILLVAFLTFIMGMFAFVSGSLKWAGSLIVFSFVLNVYGIYITFKDEPSFFRTMNFAFKLVLFIGELIAFNWVLSNFL